MAEKFFQRPRTIADSPEGEEDLKRNRSTETTIGGQMQVRKMSVSSFFQMLQMYYILF
jgi:hypothetical protein